MNLTSNLLNSVNANLMEWGVDVAPYLTKDVYRVSDVILTVYTDTSAAAGPSELVSVYANCSWAFDLECEGQLELEDALYSILQDAIEYTFDSNLYTSNQAKALVACLLDM